MLIFGHPLVESERFIIVKSKDDIKKTSPKDIVVFPFKEENFYLAEYCRQNDIVFGVFIDDLKQLLISNLWGGRFALVESDFAKEAQNIAEEYLFDMKIILQIDNEDEMVKAAKDGIDGVVFRNFIKFI